MPPLKILSDARRKKKREKKTPVMCHSAARQARSAKICLLCPDGTAASAQGKNHVRPATHRVLLSNQKPKTIVAPAKSLIAAGTGQGGIIGRGVVQHQAVEDFALHGMRGDKWENGKMGKEVGMPGVPRFCRFGKMEAFCLDCGERRPRVR